MFIEIIFFLIKWIIVNFFDWHPNFTSIFHKITAHNGKNFTDNEDNWVSTSILKKKEIK